MRKRRRAATSPAPTSPASWVFAPDCSATAVLEPLVETANPWKKPAATLAAPTPIISWSGLTSSPRRAAKLVAVAIVSVSETRVMPSAASSSAGTSPALVQGRPGVGTPWGSEPTVATPWSARPKAAETTVAATTPTRIAGRRLVRSGSTSRMREDREPEDERRGVGLAEAVDERLQLAEERVGVGREAEQLRQLPDDDRDPEAVHVADLDLFGEQVGDEAELAEAEADLDQADEDREHARQDDRRPRVSGDQQRRDRGEDQRRDRGVGPEHQDPRGPEERVADQAGDRRVEAGDRRQAGELRVGHPLRHEDRGEHEPGDQVGASRRARVVAEES